MLGLFNAHKEYTGSSKKQKFFKLLGTSGTFPEEIYACFLVLWEKKSNFLKVRKISKYFVNGGRSMINGMTLTEGPY